MPAGSLRMVLWVALPQIVTVRVPLVSMEVASLALDPHQEQQTPVIVQVRLIIAQVASLAIVQHIVLPQTVTVRVP
jgi:hypothetical protein